MDQKMKGTFGGILFGVFMLLVAFQISGQTVDTSAFGLYDDVEAQEASSTNVVYDNQSDAILSDGSTTGNWTSLTETELGNATQLSIYTESLNENNSLSATVEAYDETGTSLGTQTVALEEGRNNVDLTQIASSENIDQVDFSADLSRDSTSDVSPELTGYEGYEEGTTPYLQYLVAVFGIAIMLFSLRGL